MADRPAAPSRWAGPWRRPLYVLPAVAALLVAAWVAWPRAESVDTAPIVRGPLEVGFREEGRTRVRDRYVVSAPLDGVVARIGLEPGDRVTVGQQVAVLRPVRAGLLDPATRAQTQARLDAAESELLSARAALASATEERRRARAALARGEALAQGKLIAQSDLDTLRSEATAAESAVRTAQARERTFTVLRDGTRAALSLQGADAADARALVLRAPIDGHVMRRHLESQAPVRMGQPLLEIADPGSLDVVVEVLTEDAVRLRPGSEVRIARWGGEPPLRGRVAVVEPGGFTKVSALGVEEQRTVVVVELVGDGARYRTLGDAYRVEAAFSVWRGASVLQVPVAALFRDGDRWAVYAVEGGRARLRRVEIGHMGESMAELRGGLAEGAVVIPYPGERIRDGVRVARAE